MDVYTAELEGNYHRIVGDLGLASLPRVRGNFYPNRASYEAASGHVGATGSVRGPLEFDVLALPLSRSLPVHEFAHNVTLNVNPSVANNPTWLWEAVAVYEALEFVPPASVPCLASGHYPTLAQLNIRSPSCSIYDAGYTLMELVVEDWGLPAMRRLILTNGDTQAALGLATRDFEAAWYAFLEERYL
jgi:hypothetical protein